MLTTRSRWLALMALGVLITTACNRPSRATPVSTEDGFLSTAAAQTVEAQLTLSAASAQPTATLVPVQPSATSPVPVAPSASATTIPAATTAPSATSTTVPCNRAGFVDDVTVPDGQVFQPGASFDKVWRLKNTGSCTWDSSYSVVFDNGDAMGGPAAATLTTGNVAPGQETDVKVSLTAPLNPGTYRGNWKLRDPGGIVFGIGPQADKVFWVEIKVGEPTATPNPSFSLSFDNTHECGGETAAIFRIDNTGNAILESAEITVLNLSSNTNIFGPETSNGPFMGSGNECPPGAGSMGTGSTRFVGASLGAQPPSGADARATIKLCTQNNLGGVCVDKTVDFAIP